MKVFWRQLDRLLRGQEGLRTEGALRELLAGHLVVAILLLGAVYGFFMGWYGIFSRTTPEYRQLLACLWKVPALFLLTLGICFPSLYVFSALLGSRLNFSATLKLLVAVVALTVTVLASFGPIVAFFAISTENYPFMKLLNVAFFATAGVLGVGALLRTLQSLTVPVATAPSPPPQAPPLLSRPETNQSPARQVVRLFRVWILIYGLVGAQMGWVLRPFLGDPGQPFSWFRARHANVFVDLWGTLVNLFH